MMNVTNKRVSYIASIFAGAATGAPPRRKSKGTRRGSRDGRGHKFKGKVQDLEMDEDRNARLARRKIMVSKNVASVAAPMAIWMRVVTDYGRTIMMNADQFDAGGIRGVKSAVPHFS